MRGQLRHTWHHLASCVLPVGTDSEGDEADPMASEGNPKSILGSHTWCSGVHIRPVHSPCTVTAAGS